MNWKLFIKSTLFLVFTSIIAAIMHYLAKTENMIEYTLLGFFAGVMGGILYGTNMGWDLAKVRYKNEVDKALEACSFTCFGTDMKEEKNKDWHDSRCLSDSPYISDGCKCMR